MLFRSVVVVDEESSLQPVVEEIRRHKAAIEFVRDHAKKKLPITLDVVKKIIGLNSGSGDLGGAPSRPVKITTVSITEK